MSLKDNRMMGYSVTTATLRDSISSSISRIRVSIIWGCYNILMIGAVVVVIGLDCILRDKMMRKRKGLVGTRIDTLANELPR